MVPALAAILDTVARAVLGDASDGDVGARMGEVTLRPHQRDALRRVRASIARVGGALLADEPGLGKTYVALALARECPFAVVVAPAALRGMWRDAASRAGMDLPFVSLESLSRGDHDVAERGGLVIVDEAHHACNPAAARYTRLARLVAWRHVLLLSATPVRNRRRELGALLALFMGPRAHSLDDAARSRCIVRRAGDAALLPAIDGPHWRRVRAVIGVAPSIVRLPPPLPALDGRRASALVAMTLARCWASSVAALDAALRRRLQRGAALEALLDAGRMPTRDELRAWVVGDDAVQLAFPAFAAHQTSDAARLGVVLETHLAGVRALRARIASQIGRDAARRARLLLDVRQLNAGARIVAFTAHATTAEAVYRALSREPGIALLTARGARTAGGARPRSDVIAALSGATDRPAATAAGTRATGDADAVRVARDDISLVVTTDLLSEGVNLQGASVIVHLDIPWTPASLDQRVGRAVRMGSPHACVRVHGLAPPPSAERLLKLERRLVRKHAEAVHAGRAAEDTERLHTLVAPWRAGGAAPPERPMVAVACAERAGCVAVLDEGGDPALVAGILRGHHQWRISDAPGEIYELLRTMRPCARECAAECAADLDPAFEAHARASLHRWLASRLARESCGSEDPASPARRSLLARVDAAVAPTGAHTRATTGARIARLRALVQRAAGAGAERTLLELAHFETADTDAWLTLCERRLAATGGPRAPRAGSPPVVRALLLLRRCR
jgi:superfamily II DNA or RNA helicase